MKRVSLRLSLTSLALENLIVQRLLVPSFDIAPSMLYHRASNESLQLLTSCNIRTC
jgi:hypothetical protein